MQTLFYTTSIILLFSIVQSTTVTLDVVGECLSNLATHELSNSYNYLQLSSKLGAINSYPGFSSLLMKLSDDDTSKSHDIVKFLTLRKIKLDRLINTKGVLIRNEIKNANNIHDILKEAHHQNEKTWDMVKRCHEEANKINDANIQDYLESHVLNHHIKVDKLLTDFQHRLNDSQESEKELMTFMLDEELLNTYGDRRKDIFS